MNKVVFSHVDYSLCVQVRGRLHAWTERESSVRAGW